MFVNVAVAKLIVEKLYFQIHALSAHQIVNRSVELGSFEERDAYLRCYASKGPIVGLKFKAESQSKVSESLCAIVIHESRTILRFA